MNIIQSIKDHLTENEFEDFIETARNYFEGGLSLRNGLKTSTSTSNIEKKVVFSEPKVYDWSKHENFTANDIINSNPERAQQLLRLNFTPRPYQLRMARPGIERKNSIICLQTGAGKTFVRSFIAFKRRE